MKQRRYLVRKPLTGPTVRVRCWATVRAKRRYTTQLAALRALNGQQARHDTGGLPQKRCTRAYECPACGGWHLTSIPTAPARGGEARAA